MRASQAFNAGSIPVTRSNFHSFRHLTFFVYFDFRLLTCGLIYAIIRYICTKNSYGGSDGAEKRYAKTER